MREALGGLTTRGKLFLAAAAGATLAALILGEKDLLGLILLPFAEETRGKALPA